VTLSGNNVDYLVAFLGGIIVSFTPCVYPLIPVSVGYIGASASGSKFKGLGLSLTYVTGVAITYSILGLIAAFTGTTFGKISSSPITYLFIGGIIILFGLSMLDLFVIPLPQFFKKTNLKKHHSSSTKVFNKGHNYLSAFLLGLGSGLIVSPCLTPVLGSILVYLTTKNNLFYGATLLLSFAYGMGLLLVLAGTFSSLLTSIPKSGKWLIYIKRIYAFILIGAGIYFISTGIRRF
jgi:thiol:disulfide interchange protein DsbD